MRSRTRLRVTVKSCNSSSPGLLTSWNSKKKRLNSRRKKLSGNKTLNSRIRRSRWTTSSPRKRCCLSSKTPGLWNRDSSTTKRTATRCSFLSYWMLRSRVRRTLSVSSKESSNNTLSSWKLLRKQRRPKLKRTFLRLSATSKLRISDLRMRRTCKRKRKPTSKTKFNKLSRRMRSTLWSCRIRAWLRRSTRAASLRSKRK